jgi:hypothetical protein
LVSGPPPPRFSPPSSGAQAQPRSCWSTLFRHTPRVQSPPPNEGVSRSLWLWSAPLAHLGACPTGLEPPLRAGRGACPRPSHPVHAGEALHVGDLLHFAAPFDTAVTVRLADQESDDTVRGHVPGKLLFSNALRPWAVTERRPRDRPTGHSEGTYAGRRMDGSGRSEASPATTYSVFTADGSMTRRAERAVALGHGSRHVGLTKCAFSWKFICSVLVRTGQGPRCRTQPLTTPPRPDTQHILCGVDKDAART